MTIYEIQVSDFYSDNLYLASIGCRNSGTGSVAKDNIRQLVDTVGFAQYSWLILIGVAHKAARLGIEDSLVFDTFTHWKGPWKTVPVSPAREEIFTLLNDKFAIISNTLHKVEHSLEAMIPFLQYFNKDINRANSGSDHES
jgi:AmmeMemoRadiSam system protein B